MEPHTDYKESMLSVGDREPGGVPLLGGTWQ